MPGEEVLTVVLGERELHMPPALEPAIRRIAHGQQFVLSELRDLLDEESRLVLAKRLLREGLLEIVVADGA
ncbi:MAG: hypothetical protein LC733_08615 [Actinobacteria bacterium]|nr:hypothetical protein [Actinomycetota bacterium]